MSWEFNDYGKDIAETMENLFNYCTEDEDYENQYHATYDGCNEIVRVWKWQKGNDFDERFKNIPGYNAEQHCIVLSNELFREVDPVTIRRFFNSLPIDCRTPVRYEGKTKNEWYRIYDMASWQINNADSLPANVINYHGLVELRELKKKAYAIYDAHRWDSDYTEESIAEFKKRQNVVNYFVGRTPSQTVDEETANFMNNHYPDVHAHVGAKMSRLINKWCKLIGMDKKKGYDFNYEYSKYSDAINPIQLNETLVFSWNPLDYLTMSFGSSWTSCHSIDKFNRHRYDCRGEYHGCFSSGTLSYMLDRTSVVVYAIKKGADQGNTPLWNLPKIHRQMFHFDSDNGKLIVQGRLYPDDQHDAGYDTDPSAYVQYREIIQSIIAQAYNIPNLWQKNKRGTYECNDVINSYGTHYTDYSHYDNCNVSLHQSVTESFKIDVGHDPICPSCGDTHYFEEWCTCEDCRGAHSGEQQCYDCGEWHDESHMHYIDGEWYCENHCYYCDYHGTWEIGDHDDETTHVEGYGDVCNDGLECMLEDEDVYECEYCGDYVHYSNSYDVEDTENGDTYHFCGSYCRDRWLENHDGEYEAV